MKIKYLYSIRVFFNDLIHFLKIHILNAYGIVPFDDYHKRHLSRQIVLLITLCPLSFLFSLMLLKLGIVQWE